MYDSLQASTWNWTVPFLFHQSFQNRNEKSKTISNTEPWALHRRPPSFWTAQGVGASSRSTSEDSDAKSQIRTALHQNRENRPEQLLSQMFKEVRAKRPVNIPEADQIDRWKNTRLPSTAVTRTAGWFQPAPGFHPGRAGRDKNQAWWSLLLGAKMARSSASRP